MPTNLNVRVLTDGTIFVQYQENGKAKDGSFPTWNAFADWLWDLILDAARTK